MCRHWTSCQPAAQCKPAEASSPCTRCSRCETQRCIAAQQGTSCLLLELASRHWRAITPAATHRQPSATAPPDSDVDDQYLSTIAIRRHIPTITIPIEYQYLQGITATQLLLHQHASFACPNVNQDRAQGWSTRDEANCPPTTHFLVQGYPLQIGAKNKVRNV